LQTRFGGRGKAENHLIKQTVVAFLEFCGGWRLKTLLIKDKLVRYNYSRPHMGRRDLSKKIRSYLTKDEASDIKNRQFLISGLAARGGYFFIKTFS
jgi:hypothetical protein